MYRLPVQTRRFGLPMFVANRGEDVFKGIDIELVLLSGELAGNCGGRGLGAAY